MAGLLHRQGIHAVAGNDDLAVHTVDDSAILKGDAADLALAVPLDGHVVLPVETQGAAAFVESQFEPAGFSEIFNK